MVGKWRADGRVNVDLYSGPIFDPVDVIVDMVGSGSIQVGFLSIIMSKLTIARTW
jgi:hypothetical protein